MAKFKIQFQSGDDHDPLALHRDKYGVLNNLINYLSSLMIGARTGSCTVDVGHTGAKASGTVTLATASGDIVVTINGVALDTVAYDTDDETTATAIAAVINAETDNLVDQHVTASASGAVVTITAKNVGHVGNAITLAVSGTNATASGARLTGGSDTATQITF